MDFELGFKHMQKLLPLVLLLEHLFSLTSITGKQLFGHATCSSLPEFIAAFLTLSCQIGGDNVTMIWMSQSSKA